MGIYWYEFRPGLKDTVEWIRHIVDYGGRAGGGLQMVVEDIDGDGDRDIVTPGKTGLFLSENLTWGVDECWIGEGGGWIDCGFLIEDWGFIGDLLMMADWLRNLH